MSRAIIVEAPHRVLTVFVLVEIDIRENDCFFIFTKHWIMWAQNHETGTAAEGSAGTLSRQFNKHLI